MQAAPRRMTGIHLDPREQEPLYRQIFDQIVERVRSGAYPAGHRLPPTRDLAAELGAHRNTVVRAYADLEAAGFVASVVGRGTFVVEQPAGAALSAPIERPALPWSSLISTAANAEPLGRFDRLARAPAHRDSINLARLQPSEDLIPDDLFQRCLDHVLRTLGGRALDYGPREGLLRLRGLVAEDLVRQGVPAQAEDVIITTGSQQAIDLAARLLVDPGDAFLVDVLTYSGAITTLAAAGARVTGVPADDEGPSLAALERLAALRPKGFYLIPSAHNPTGLSLAARRREAIVAWSRRHAVPLLEDDYSADLALGEGPAAPALRSFDGDVIYLGTFSKRLIPALRVGFMLCPKGIFRHAVALKHTLDCGTSLLLQHALAEFLERGYLRAHLGRTVPEYRARRDALEAALRAHLPSSFRWRQPHHGVALWLPLPPAYHSEEVGEEARRRGVIVSPSALYAVEPRGPSGLRLTFCAEPAERLREGARRLGRAIAALAPLERRDGQGPPGPTLDLV